MNNTSHGILNSIGGCDQNNLKNILEEFDITKEETQEHFSISNYYDLEGAAKILLEQQSKFITLTLNIEGLNAKFDKLTTFLEMLSNKGIYFDAINLQETWLPDPESANYDIFNIPGYNLIAQGRKCGTKGGLVTYLKENYTYLIRKVYKESKHWEGLFIDVTSENLQRKITIANIYRPPRDNYSNISIDNFLRPITKIINVMKNENSTLIWVGDFNINLLQIEQREKYQEYFEIFTSNGLLPQITLPTRLSKRKGTLIDQIFCKLSGSVTTATSGILVNKISDHLPCFTCIDVLKQRQKIPKYVKICTKNNAAIQAFKTEVNNKIETTCFENNLLTDPNHNYNKLDNILQNAKKEHLPEKM